MQSNQSHSHRHSAQQYIGEYAQAALIAEARLTPKPGLVDAQNNGSHDDLDLALMIRSASCLTPYFTEMAAAGDGQPVSQWLRETIGRIGREAEACMLAETHGVNTHRGAIWALGLLSTATTMTGKACQSATHVCQLAGQLAQIEDRHAPVTFSKGQRASNHYQVNGAKQQAQLGFPAITRHALPTLQHSRRLGHSETEAQLNALLSLTAHLTDTCVLHRAGLVGQTHLQQCSRDILAQGGVSTSQGMARLQQLDRDMVALHASPGGAADLLAATLFVDWVTHPAQSK